MGGGGGEVAVGIVVMLFGIVLGFNLEPKLPVIKRGDPSSYFGFSVAQHLTDGNIPWILVGAPLGQNLQPSTNRSGALFKCNPLSGNETDCQQVVTDGKRDPINGYYDRKLDSSELFPPLEDELKDGQWLGVNVKSQGGKGKVVVCAHRYVHQGRDFRWGLGLCHFLDTNLDYHDTLEPCRNRQKRALEDYGYCQAGTSADLLEDDTAVLGAPGAFTCRGMVYGISVSDDYLTKDITHHHNQVENNSTVDKYSYLGMSVIGGKFFGEHWTYAAGAPKAALGSGQVIFFTKSTEPSGILNVEGELTGEGFAFGFGNSLAVLDANGDGKSDLVVGAPFYMEMDEKSVGGAVYIYLNKQGFAKNHPFSRLTGTTESRFGVAISSLGDINKDGFEDLAVGSPYSDGGRGTVFIYLGSKDGIIKDPSQVIKASESFPSMRTFGYSLSGGVDLDLNTYPDLLVGAYDADVVVLLRSRPIIDIYTEVLGNLTNIDPNNRSCGLPDEDRLCFELQACFEIRGGSQLHSSSLVIEYKIEAETFIEGKTFSRVLFYRGVPDRPQVIRKNITVRRSEANSRRCSNEVVILRDNVPDIQSPIPFKLTYTLIQNKPYSYRPNTLPNIQDYPILNQQEASKIVLAHFEKDCGENDLCESDIVVKATAELETDAEDIYLLVLGKNHFVVINVSVNNFGEPAYESVLYISHPSSLSFYELLEDGQRKGLGCTPQPNASIVKCPLGNPYKRQADFQTMRIKFDAKNLKDIETRLDFSIWANSTSNETDVQNDRSNVVMTVVKIAELSIQGSVEPEKSFYGGKVVGESAIKTFSEIGPRITHQYTIWNSGPWKATFFNVDILWPHQVENGRSQGKWLLYMEQPPTIDGAGSCFLPPNVTDVLHLRTKRDTERIIAPQTERDSNGNLRTFVEMNCMRGSAKCFKIECIIHNLLPLESAVIKIHSRLWNSTLVEDYASVDEVRIKSRAMIRISNEIRQDVENDVAMAVTTCYPDLKLKVELEGIAWYIYAVSILAGMLLLALIIYCLYRTGFFKRRRPVPTHTASVTRS